MRRRIWNSKRYTAYELEPERNPDAAWRMDVFAGVTRCPGTRQRSTLQVKAA